MSTRDARSLLRLPDDIEPYPAEPSDEALAASLGIPVADLIRFDMNTLGGGPLPAVRAALESFDAGRLVEYGDQAYVALRAAIHRATGAPDHRILPGAGADELIRLVTTAVVGAGDAVVVPTPTFAMFAVEARLAGAQVVDVPRSDPAVRQPVAAIRDAARRSASRLVWLCSPNNPTGDGYTLEEISELADGLDAIVVVDAVYQEFAEADAGMEPEALSPMPLQDRLPNLLILRSLAKAYGLAGARVGYLLLPDGLATRFEAARLPLAIGAASEAAAIAALSDLATARTRLADIVAQRRRLASALEQLAWQVMPSVTNFLLVRPPDAQHVAADLLRRGLAVREYPSGMLRGWLRITARAAHETDRLLEALGA